MTRANQSPTHVLRHCAETHAYILPGAIVPFVLLIALLNYVCRKGHCLANIGQASLSIP